jgi:predicted XRE-type DNA-binding protein
MAKSNNTVPTNPVQVELESIKRLLVLGLLMNGASQSAIAAALGVHQSQISRMVPGLTKLVTVKGAGK